MEVPSSDWVVKDRLLLLILSIGFVLMVYGIWVRAPLALGPDEKTAVTKALWMGVNRSPFIPDFKKGGNLYLYVLAGSFIPYFLYLLLTGRVGVLAQQARGTETFFTAPPELQSAFYDFVLIGRFVSVVFGVVCIYLTYILARETYSQRAARYSAAIIALSMGFVNTAHYATEDVLLTTLVVGTLLLLFRYLQNGRIRDLWATTFSAGLAVSAKMTAVFLAAPIAYAVLSVVRGRHKTVRNAFRTLTKHFLTGATVTIVVYVLTTPSILVYPNLYINAMFSESSAAFSTSPYIASPTWFLHVVSWMRAFGLPSFLLVVAGLGALPVRAYHGRATRREYVILLFLIPYAVFIGSWQTTEVWYAIPIVPLFAVYAGHAASVVTDGSGNVDIRSVFIASILLFSAVYTGVTVNQFANDARVEASEWTANELEASEEVDVYQYPLHLPAFPDGTAVNRHQFNSSSDRSFSTAEQRVSCGVPDTIVLSSANYAHYLHNPGADPPVTRFYNELLSRDGEYEIVRVFGPRPVDVSERSEFLMLSVVPRTVTNHDLRIIVLRRQTEQATACGGGEGGSGA